jgi:hypothetical protein
METRMVSVDPFTTQAANAGLPGKAVVAKAKRLSRQPVPRFKQAEEAIAADALEMEPESLPASVSAQLGFGITMSNIPGAR